LSHLHDKILFFFSARDRIYAVKDRHRERSGYRLLIENEAAVSGDVTHATRSAVRDVIYYAGGISAILYLVGTAHVRTSPTSHYTLSS